MSRLIPNNIQASVVGIPLNSFKTVPFASTPAVMQEMV